MRTSIKTFLLIAFTIFFASQIYCQESNIWYFGDNAGLDFNTLPPTVLTNGQLSTEEGCASICDATGNLLFYTDGVTVWDRNHNIMPNGTGLFGNISSTQSALAIPKPGSTDIYYLFTIGGGPYAVSGHVGDFCYSIVDFSVNPDGEVTAKNIPLINGDITEKLTAVKHGNGQDIWVIVHEWNNNTFRAYLIDAASAPGTWTYVSSNAGSSHTGNGLNSIGYLKASPDGGSLATAIMYNSDYELFNFDVCTGIISYDRGFYSYDFAYGMEFSPDGSKLYLLDNPIGTTHRLGNLYQYDLQTGLTNHIATSTTSIAEIQVAPDGNIYCAKCYIDFAGNITNNSDYLGIIDNPNSTSATYTDNGILLDLSGFNINQSAAGLPSFMQSYFAIEQEILVADTCEGESVQISLINPNGLSASDVSWDFGDGSPAVNGVSTSHTYASPGLYTITCDINCFPQISRDIEILPIPTINISGSTPVCEGDNITFNETGGEATSWYWSGPDLFTSNMQNPTIIAATTANSGNYNLTISNGTCEANTSINIQVDAMPDATINSQADLCENDAAVTLNAASGGGTWSGTGVSGNTFNPATAGIGTHTVTYNVTNGACTNSDTENIQVDAMPDATIAPQADLCENDAAVTLNAASGGGTWSGTGVSGNTFNPATAGAGTHTITYNVISGACSDSDTENITVDNLPNATITPQADLCENDAAVTLNAASGGGTWSGTGVSGNTFNPATAGIGTHTVTYNVTNGACTNSDTENIQVDAMPDATIAPQADLCENDAAVTLNAASGGGTWSGTGVSGNIFNPATAGAGTHTITYNIISGACSDSDTENIQVDAIITATINPVANMCLADPTITLSATNPGGTWSGNGVSGNTFDPSIAGIGTHTITYIITNGACVSQDQITITVANSYDATINPQTDLCENDNFVVLNANDAGGTWSGNGVVGNFFDPSVAGPGDHVITYNVGSGGCADSDNITIHVDAMPNATISPIANLCISDPAIALNASTPGGVWSGNGVVGSNFNPSVAGVGTHTVSYTISIGSCNANDTESITVDGLPNVIITGTSNFCIDGANGTYFNAIGSGTWSGNGIINASTGEFSPLAAGIGTHIISYQNTNGACTSIGNINIEVHDLPNINLVNSQDPLCFGGNTGVITVSSLGSTSPSYVWDIPSSGSTISGLSSGTYTLTVNDTYCSNTASFILNDPPQFTASITIDNEVSCYNGTDGSLSVNTLNGIPPYAYSWDTGASQMPYTGLNPGTYTVDVIDGNNCIASDSETLANPTQIQANSTVADVICGANGGNITLNPSGGSSPYSYDWSHNPSLNNNSANGLAIGTYTISVSDDNNCEIIITENINSINDLNVNINIIEPIGCAGSSTATMEATCTDGYGIIQYFWPANSHSGATNTNLSAGDYSVIATDDYGCTGTDNISITNPQGIILNYTVTPVTCKSFADGSATVSPTGGVFPYIVNWEDGQMGNTASDLAGGTYTVSVTDANGCSASQNLTIPEALTYLEINAIINNVSCFGKNNGEGLISGSGGSAPYSITWYNGYTGNHLDNLSPGEYNVSIQDNYGCVIDTSILITEPSQIELSYAVSNPSCYGNDDGSINLEVAGGTAPYTFFWTETVLDFPALVGLEEGNYGVTVSDANDCKESINTIILTDTPQDCIKIPNAFTPNGDGINDSWIIENIDLFPEHYVQVFNRWGQELYHGGIETEPWNGTTFEGKFVPAGSYVYVVNLHNGIKAEVGIVTVVY